MVVVKPEDLEQIRNLIHEEVGPLYRSAMWWLVLIWALSLIASLKAGEIPADYANLLADAIFVAEGGVKAKVPYGILSVKVRDKAEARRVCLNTIRNNWRRWEEAGRKGEYLEFLARRYAPVGAQNDPKGLNRHWLRNVKENLK